MAAGRTRTGSDGASRRTQEARASSAVPFAGSLSRRRAMPDRWEQYGIDPAEMTASADAALIGNAVARQCADDASAALLRTLSERATPLTTSSTKGSAGGV